MILTRRGLMALTGATAALSAMPLFAQDKGTIGIAMPTKSSSRWISDGDSMVKAFQEAGYATDPNYASKLVAIARSPRMQQALAQLGVGSSLSTQ